MSGLSLPCESTHRRRMSHKMVNGIGYGRIGNPCDIPRNITAWCLPRWIATYSDIRRDLLEKKHHQSILYKIGTWNVRLLTENLTKVKRRLRRIKYMSDIHGRRPYVCVTMRMAYLRRMTMLPARVEEEKANEKCWLIVKTHPFPRHRPTLFLLTGDV